MSEEVTFSPRAYGLQTLFAGMNEMADTFSSHSLFFCFSIVCVILSRPDF